MGGLRVVCAMLFLFSCVALFAIIVIHFFTYIAWWAGLLAFVALHPIFILVGRGMDKINGYEPKHYPIAPNDIVAEAHESAAPMRKDEIPTNRFQLMDM